MPGLPHKLRDFAWRVIVTLAAKRGRRGAVAGGYGRRQKVLAGLAEPRSVLFSDVPARLMLEQVLRVLLLFFLLARSVFGLLTAFLAGAAFLAGVRFVFGFAAPGSGALAESIAFVFIVLLLDRVAVVTIHHSGSEKQQVICHDSP